MISDTAVQPTEDELDHAWTKREKALSRAELSALYHQKRERFFELCDKLGKAVTLFGGSAALWKMADPHWVAWSAVVISAASAASLVLSFPERARRHAELSKGFREITAEIVSAGDFDITDSKASLWMGEVCSLEAKEPPALSALVVMCQNEIALARRSKVYDQPFWVRLLANFLDLPNRAKTDGRIPA